MVNPLLIKRTAEHHAARHPRGGLDEIRKPLNILAIPDLPVSKIPDLPASKITSGRFPLGRLTDGTDGLVLTGQGAGFNPAYEALPPAGDKYAQVIAWLGL